MRMTRLFMPTEKEDFKNAKCKSFNLMQRAGLIKQVSSGIFTYLPVGYKVLRKIANIVREEMNNEDAVELFMSALLPKEPYEQSGRWEVFGDSMFKFRGRDGKDLCLGPTHEELFVETVKNELDSYKDYPINLYQIQNKYRDEIRPRLGVIRSKEFLMKDAYSFDIDEKGLDLAYEKMRRAYKAIFDRLNLDYMTVEADSGAMGGSGSEEFMAISEIGEDGILHCEACGYAANVETAKSKKTEYKDEDLKELEKIETVNQKSIEDITNYLNVDATKTVKMLVYKTEREFVSVLIRGDREVNEVKLQNYLKSNELELATDYEIEEKTGSKKGFLGPVGIDNIRIIADEDLKGLKNFVTGANEIDYHYINTNFDRDFTVEEFEDINTVVKGDTCICGETLDNVTGIEIGHIFKLGTKYSESLGLTYKDENNDEIPVVMGCYGIGVSRLMASAIEQGADENGIVWPEEITPFDAVIIPISTKDDTQMELSEEIYSKLKKDRVDILFDDRNERAGVKFKDADLAGMPIKIVVGRRAEEGIVEYTTRDGKTEEITVDELTQKF